MVWLPNDREFVPEHCLAGLSESSLCSTTPSSWVKFLGYKLSDQVSEKSL